MGATAQLSKELRQYGITANCILPSADTTLFPKTSQRAGSDIPATFSLEPKYVAPLIVYLATDEARDVTGQFFYASGGDVGHYNHPLRMRTFVRKWGKWTIDELSDVIPPLLVAK
jgi:NAD(P)-dependent dehydrogenase (short-subunit alcohol dehydrogenase family)